MFFSQVKALVPLLAAVYAAFYLYTPLPADISSPWVTQGLYTAFKVISLANSAAEHLGISTSVDATIFLIDQLLHSIYWLTGDYTGSEITVEEDIFDGIRVVIYKPSLERPTNNLLPGYVFYHGGGWTVGSVLIGHSIIKKLVEESKVVAILVDYRMAPHVKFPVQFEDCLKATKYFMANAGRFGVDGHRIGVGGDSAGGNLAAAISLKLRDDKTFGFVPKVQVLVYPALQVIDLYTPSYQQTFDRTFMSREGMAWFWSMYITGSANMTKDIALGNHVPLDVKQRFAKSFLNHDDLDDQFKYLPYKKPELTEGDGEI